MEKEKESIKAYLYALEGEKDGKLCGWRSLLFLFLEEREGLDLAEGKKKNTKNTVLSKKERKNKIKTKNGSS
jgi:hypothetical protein